MKKTFFIFSFILFCNYTHAQGLCKFYPIIQKLHPTKNETVGFLLGWDSGDTFRTVLLAYSNKELKEVENIPAIASPQQDGFYFIQKLQIDTVLNCQGVFADLSGTYLNARSLYDKNTGEYFTVDTLTSDTLEYRIINDRSITHTIEKLQVSRDLKSALQLKQAEDSIISSLADIDLLKDFCSDEYGQSMSNYSAKSLLFIAKGMMTITYSDYYDGGAHPDGNTIIQTLPLKGGEPFMLKDFFSLEKIQMIKSKVIKDWENDTLLKKELCGDIPPDTTRNDFSMLRENGLLKINYETVRPAPYVCNGGPDYPISEAMGSAPGKIVSYNKFPLEFEKFVKIDKGVKDVFVSPGENLAIVVTGTDLIAIDVTTQKEIYHHENMVTGPIVMVEWSVGEKNTFNWTKELTKKNY